MRDPADTCEHCPAFVKQLDANGREILIPLRDAQGNPITKGGEPQFEQGEDFRFVFTGTCRLHAAQLLPDGRTTYPQPKSNWWCEDPARYAMIERMGKKTTK